MKFSDFAIVFATLLGPILAVQAQKYLERLRDSKRNKIWIFKALMATRATRVSPRHVDALNAIDLEFGDSSKYKKVIDYWHIYLDHLNDNQMTEAEPYQWVMKGDDLFTDLLYEMSLSLGYRFDKVYIKRSAYYPKAHLDSQEQQMEFIKSITEMTKKISQ